MAAYSGNCGTVVAGYRKTLQNQARDEGEMPSSSAVFLPLDIILPLSSSCRHELRACKINNSAFGPGRAFSRARWRP